MKSVSLLFALILATDKTIELLTNCFVHIREYFVRELFHPQISAIKALKLRDVEKQIEMSNGLSILLTTNNGLHPDTDCVNLMKHHRESNITL